MEPIFFDSPAAFRDWLEANHDHQSELLVGFHKRHTSRPSLTWSQSVDQALCFGWIDGIRRSVDGEGYTIRFTPRKPDSVWSAVNMRKVEELSKQGLMRPAGLRAFEARSEEKSRLYSYEQRHSAALEADEEQRFSSNARAWRFFEAQARWYRQTALYWVTSAKQASTRERRLAQLIEDSERGRRLRQLDRPAQGASQGRGPGIGAADTATSKTELEAVLTVGAETGAAGGCGRATSARRVVRAAALPPAPIASIITNPMKAPFKTVS